MCTSWFSPSILTYLTAEKACNLMLDTFAQKEIKIEHSPSPKDWSLCSLNKKSGSGSYQQRSYVVNHYAAPCTTRYLSLQPKRHKNKQVDMRSNWHEETMRDNTDITVQVEDWILWILVFLLSLPCVGSFNSLTEQFVTCSSCPICCCVLWKVDAETILYILK